MRRSNQGVFGTRGLATQTVILLLSCALSACVPAGSLRVRPESAVGRSRHDLHSVLRRSCTGRHLLKSLNGPYATGVDAGLQMFTFEVASAVQEASGPLVEPTSNGLIVAVRKLRRLPSRCRCDPLIGIMVVIEEWTAETVAVDGSVHRITTLIDALHRFAPRQADEIDPWLKRTYPTLRQRALEILTFLT